MEHSSLLLASIFCALALTACASDNTMSGLQSPAPVSTDIAVMQFALNLEYLDANFYSCAAYGLPLDASLSGGGPNPLGCEKALLSPDAQYYADSTAQDEIKHVALLRSALGAHAFPQPLLDIGMAFQVAADVAVNTTLSPPFSAYGSDALFYHAAFIFEDVGVTAYGGALPLISASLLPTAAGIMAVEAYHGGSIRTLLLAIQDQTVFPYSTEVTNTIAAISALRGAVGGGMDAGLVSSQGSYIIAPTDANAVAFSRTTSEVLAIVYLGGKAKGGFFPNGLNGTISSLVAPPAVGDPVSFPPVPPAPVPYVPGDKLQPTQQTVLLAFGMDGQHVLNDRDQNTLFRHNVEASTVLFFRATGRTVDAKVYSLTAGSVNADLLLTFEDGVSDSAAEAQSFVSAAAASLPAFHDAFDTNVLSPFGVSSVSSSLTSVADGSSNDNNKTPTVAIAVGAGGGAAMLLIIAAVVLVYVRRRRASQVQPTPEASRVLVGPVAASQGMDASQGMERKGV